jgi:very-short-patch-repair endonuclease
MSAKSWTRAVTAGDLRLVHRGVALLPGGMPSVETSILAAVLSVGRGALASHRSAAYLWGIDAPTDVVDLIVDNRAPRARRDSVVVHRPRDRRDLRPIKRNGIPTTNPLRVLLDLGAVSPDLVLPALETLVADGRVSIGAARAARRRHSERGRAGLGALDSALDAWSIGERPPDSVLEVRVSAFLRKHRIDGFVFHPVVNGIELDFGHVGRKVDLEFDGWATHRARDQFERDRERDLILTAAGWVVVRVTWLHFTRRPYWVADKLRQVLNDRSIGPE